MLLVCREQIYLQAKLILKDYYCSAGGKLREIFKLGNSNKSSVGTLLYDHKGVVAFRKPTLPIV